MNEQRQGCGGVGWEGKQEGRVGQQQSLMMSWELQASVSQSQSRVKQLGLTLCIPSGCGVTIHEKTHSSGLL